MQNAESKSAFLEELMKIISLEIDEIFFHANTIVPCPNLDRINLDAFYWDVRLKNPVLEISLIVPDTDETNMTN